MHRHPGAVAYLKGPSGAAPPLLVREHGYVRQWLESGGVRDLGVADDGSLTVSLQVELGLPLSKLAADLASGVPDLDAVEWLLCDASLSRSAEAASGAA